MDAVPKEDVDSGWLSNTIRTAIEKVVAIVDRQEGLGMKLTKVHCPTHTDYNLTMWGLNQNTNSGPCESGHKEHIKKMPSEHNIERINLTSRLLSNR